MIFAVFFAGAKKQTIAPNKAGEKRKSGSVQEGMRQRKGCKKEAGYASQWKEPGLRLCFHSPSHASVKDTAEPILPEQLFQFHQMSVHQRSFNLVSSLYPLFLCHSVFALAVCSPLQSLFAVFTTLLRQHLLLLGAHIRA